jgi:DNA-binding LacI/PurR family transcriptional regulator
MGYAPNAAARTLARGTAGTVGLVIPKASHRGWNTVTVSAHSGYLATQRLIARGHKFTALFTGNDMIAFDAIKALNEAGFRIPEDIALVSDGCQVFSLS